MKCFIIVVLLAHLASTRFLVSHSVLKVIYGNIGQLRDLELPSADYSGDTRRTMNDHVGFAEHGQMPDFQHFLDELEHFPLSLKMNTSTDIDVKDFNDASKTLADVKRNLKEVIRTQVPDTRRQKLDLPPSEILALHGEPIKLREWYYQKLSLTFLIHIRFQVDAAIRYKLGSVGMRGYKIGYLFHRLVDLKNKMQRIRMELVTLTTERLMQNRPNWRTKKHSLALVLRLCERMQQLDVDIKDTDEMIKLIYYQRPLFQEEQATKPTPPLPI